MAVSTSPAAPASSHGICYDSDEKTPQPSERAADDASQHSHSPCDDNSTSPYEFSADDPESPLNWPAHKKWKALLLVASLTFLTLVPNT